MSLSHPAPEGLGEPELAAYRLATAAVDAAQAARNAFDDLHFAQGDSIECELWRQAANRCVEGYMSILDSQDLAWAIAAMRAKEASK